MYYYMVCTYYYHMGLYMYYKLYYLLPSDYVHGMLLHVNVVTQYITIVN